MAHADSDSELADLHDDVLAMGETVTARLRRAVSALEAGDHELARYVRDGDGEINAMYLDIEHRCIDLLTREQPVAGELRAVVAAFKISTDLERVGDLATNLGAYVRAMEQDRPAREELVDIGHMVERQLDDALMAFAVRDGADCHAVAQQDDDVDARCSVATDLLVRDLLEERMATDEVQEALTSSYRRLLIVRDLERIGDHAVNVAARTLYMVDNDTSLLY